MSKGLCNMSEYERRNAIDRRLRQRAGGLGTISAAEAVEKELDKAKKNYRNIKEMVDAVTPENKQELVDWGSDMGKEVI